MDGKKKTSIPAPRSTNSLTVRKTKPAGNDRTSVKRKEEEEQKAKSVGKSVIEKKQAGSENETKKEFSRIRSKTWEKEEFEARKKVGKSTERNRNEERKEISGSDEKSKAGGKGERSKDKRIDEWMKNEKITGSDQIEKAERKEDEGMECLERNEVQEAMNNTEQIDADSQDKYSDDFEDYDSDFEEDEESVAGMAGNESEKNGEEIDAGKDELSVVGLLEGKKNIFSSRDDDEVREDWMRREEGIESVKEDRKIVEDVRIDSKWRESDLEANPFQSKADSPRIKRINDLSQLVRLSCITYHVYDSPPLNYDLFIKLFGRKHTKQVETQTKETNEISCQTDSSSFKEKKCQFPNYISNVESDEDFSESWKERGKVQSDPFKLRLFLLKAEQVINVSLERRFTSATRSKSAKRLLKIPAALQGFCTQFYKLIPPPFYAPSSTKLGVKNLTCDSSYLISCQTNPHEEEREESFISLWSLKNSTQDKAEHLFRTRSKVTCLLSDHRHTIYAGSSDGSITLWDIRESSSSSPNLYHQSGTENPIKSCRSPSFSTACTSIPVTHTSPVTGLSLFKKNEHSNCFPRLSSVDEEGLIILWMFQDSLPSSNSPSSSDIIDGMFPGSRIKLIQETSIRIPGNECCIKTMVTSSYDPFTLFLGTSSGQVIRVSKFSQQNEPPQVYYEQGEETFTGVTCISFNPKLLTYFLVSFEDGTICLFCENRNQPILTWDPSDLQICTVISVQWFPGNGTSFAALTSSSTIIIWNLTSDVTKPSFKFQMTRY